MFYHVLFFKEIINLNHNHYWVQKLIIFNFYTYKKKYNKKLIKNKINYIYIVIKRLTKIEKKSNLKKDLCKLQNFSIF